MFRVTVSCLFFSLAVSACSSREKPAPKPVKPPQPVVQARPQAAPSNPVKRWEVTVRAGDRDREAQLVMVRLSRNPPVKAVQVREAKGAKVVGQMAGPDTLALRLNPLKAGTQATFLVDEDDNPGKPDKSDMQATESAEGIKLTLNNRPVLTFVNRPQTARKDVQTAAARGGYLHPLYSPAGVLVTDDFPKDKPFEHGIWTTWQKVENTGSHPDFWDLTRGKGRVSVESIGSVWGGPLAAGFDARQFFTDLDKHPGMTVLRDAWEVSAYRGADRYTIVDLSSLQEGINGATTLGTNTFGGIMVRGNRDWQGSSALFMTSEGKERGKAQGSTARWCYLGGKSGGKQAGIAILSFPGNSRAPESVFIDPSEPLMGFAPTEKAPFPLLKHTVLRLRYRYVVLDGAPDSKLFDKLWKDFANPPEPQVRALKSE